MAGDGVRSRRAPYAQGIGLPELRAGRGVPRGAAPLADRGRLAAEVASVVVAMLLDAEQTAIPHLSRTALVLRASVRLAPPFRNDVKSRSPIQHSLQSLVEVLMLRGD